MKFSAFMPLVFSAFRMANAGIIIRPRVELDSAYDNGLKTYEARQKDIDSVQPYLNGPDTYWARGVEARQESTFYAKGPDSRLTRDVMARDDDFDSSLAFANGRDSRWIRDVKTREDGVDSNLPFANGPSSFWVRDVEVLRSVPQARQAEADSANLYGNGPDTYLRNLKVEAREEEVDTSISRGPTSYWVRNAEDE
ncbi:hypothetical protein EDD85DRAFT_869487 [Armillaria nabsnona]|nr:hypothetical protein EDD85DRAFT_869487 [Armillaria nabsnona]